MTNHDLATALGVSVTTIERYRARGIPLPAEGEKLASWAKRAQEWRRAQRRLPGPRATKPGDPAKQEKLTGLARVRELTARKLEIEIAEREGKLHSTEQCHNEFIARLQELRNGFAQLPDQLARALYQAPTPDAIKERVEAAVARIFEVLSRD